MLSTAVAFHQISLLGERGLSTAEAAANFIPQTVAGLLIMLVTGYLVDRTNARALTAASMVLLALGLVWGTVVDPGLSAIGFGVTLGAGSAAIRALEAAAIPKYFGTRHLGAIRGPMASVGVGSTAFGPVLFAIAYEMTGSYGEVLLAGASLPLLVAVAACLTPSPDVQPVPEQST
jgi:MFS family permease